MSDLETEAQPFLETMLRGHRRTFYSGGLTTISTWAVKTSLIAAFQVKPPIPSSIYEDFYAARKPSSGTKVWLGATDSKYTLSVDHRPLKIAPDATSPAPDRLNGYATTLAIGRILFYIFVREGEGQPVQDFSGGHESILAKIWPLPESVSWPPSRALSPSAVDKLADLVGGVPRALT